MRHFKLNHFLQEKSKPRGFALIATISIMVLLMMIALAMMSLSSTEVRASQNGRAMEEARANARMALMIALGDLQKYAGPDTRVTASSSIIDSTSAPLTGVWRSWEGTNHETSGPFAGRPVVPDYELKKTSEADGGRFLSWLVSGTGADSLPTDPGSLASTAPTTDSVPLLSTGTLAAGDERGIHVVPIAVNDSGSYAWWVSGENQKARIPVPEVLVADTVAARAQVGQSHSVADPASFGLDTLLEKPQPARKAISLSSVDLIPDNAGARASELFHDLSVTSVGLLTNTATGGWRKDLSLLTESWSDQPKSDQSFFRLTPTETASATIPTSSNHSPQGSMLYPWADYRPPSASIGKVPRDAAGPVASWENLVDYATHYKRVSISPSGVATTPLHSVGIYDRSKIFESIHRVRVLPLIARIQ